MIGGVVFDPSALVDAVTGKSAHALALLDRGLSLGLVVAVPAAALIEAWACVEPDRQVDLALIADLPIVVVDPLTLDGAVDAGERAAAAGERDARAGVMHAVHLAAVRGWPVVTSEPAAARALGGDVVVRALP